MSGQKTKMNRPENLTEYFGSENLHWENFNLIKKGMAYAGSPPYVVAVTYLPSGFTEYCGSERSQHKNRELALKRLYDKIHAIETEDKPTFHPDTLKGLAWRFYQAAGLLCREQITSSKFREIVKEQITDYSEDEDWGNWMNEVKK